MIRTLGRHNKTWDMSLSETLKNIHDTTRSRQGPNRVRIALYYRGGHLGPWNIVPTTIFNY